jgi:hypothetical protein
MPRANRVQPDGSFGTVPARGAFMGNRGCLHDAEGVIRRRFSTKGWITCTLHEKPGRGPHPFPVPGRWTPLFFQDEAVACAAGHRPCAECRRAVYNDFRAAWGRAFGGVVKAAEMDRVLHAARLGPRAMALLDDLPPGAFFLWHGQPWLQGDGHALPWRPAGFGEPIPTPRGPAEILTPAPLVAVMRAGWRPVMAQSDNRPNW